MKDIDLKINGLIGESSTSRVYEVFGDERPLVLKIYKDQPHPLSVVKNTIILNAFRNFGGLAQRLETFFNEGLGFSVDLMPRESLAILHAKVEGRELSEINEPFSLEETVDLLSNVFSQIRFVEGIALPTDFEIPQAAREEFSIDNIPPLNYHGDISDTSLIVTPEGASLIDWEASLNEGVEFLTAHLIYSSPEVWEGRATDQGLEPHFADAYSMGGVICRMLLGENFYSALEEKGDGKMMINPAKVKALLEDVNVPSNVADMLRNLLSEKPQERLIQGAKNALENWNNIERILKDK